MSGSGYLDSKQKRGVNDFCRQQALYAEIEHAEVSEQARKHFKSVPYAMRRRKESQ